MEPEVGRVEEVNCACQGLGKFVYRKSWSCLIFEEATKNWGHLKWRHQMVHEITFSQGYLGIKTSIWKAQKKTWCESQSLVRRDVANVVCFIGVIGIIGKVDKHEGVGAEADEAPEDNHRIPPLPCEDHGEKCERHPSNHFSNSNQYCAQGCQWLSVGTKPDIALVKI